MSDLSSAAPPPNPSQRPVTPAPVTSGDSTPQGQTPRHSDGQPLPQEQQPAPNPAVTLSASLAGMSAGTIIDAVVQGTDPDGVPIIRAAGATFLAIAQSAPAPNAELILRIQSTGHEIAALITSVNGVPQHPPSEIRLLLTNVGGGPAGGAQAAAPVETYSAPIGGARPPEQTQSNAQPLAPGLRLTAHIVPTPMSAAALLLGDLSASEPAVASPFRVGAPLLVRIISVGVKTGPTAPLATPEPATGNPSVSTSSALPQVLPVTGPVAAAATLAALVQRPDTNAPPASPQVQGAQPTQTAAVASVGPTPQGPQPTQTAAVASGSPLLQGPQPTQTASAVPGPPIPQGSQTTPAATSEPGRPAPQGPQPAQSAATNPGAPTPQGPQPAPTEVATPGLPAPTHSQKSASTFSGTVDNQGSNKAQAATSSIVPNVAPASSAPEQAVTLSGVVLSPTADGQTLIQTPQGIFQFDAALVASAGVEVTMEARPAAAPSPSAAAIAAPAQTSAQTALANFSTGWNALQELVQAVQVADPGVARKFVSQRLPSLNSRAAANILFFLSALRGGDVRGWLGADMTQAAERAGHKRLLDRLGDDFAQLRTLIDTEDDAEWRATPFPFYDGEAIEPVNMFTRSRRPGNQTGDEEVRFVVQLELSALGAMQLDGLFRPQHFDLIVRNHTGLSEKLRQDISTLFSDAIEATGLKGNIVFQNVATFPVSPFGDLFGVAPPAGDVVA